MSQKNEFRLLRIVILAFGIISFIYGFLFMIVPSWYLNMIGGSPVLLVYVRWPGAAAKPDGRLPVDQVLVRGRSTIGLLAVAFSDHAADRLPIPNGSAGDDWSLRSRTALVEGALADEVLALLADAGGADIVPLNSVPYKSLPASLASDGAESAQLSILLARR